MDKQTRKELEQISKKHYLDGAYFEGKEYLIVFSSDEMIDHPESDDRYSQEDLLYSYAISADENDLNLYKVFYKWSETGIDSGDSSDWVDDWEHDVLCVDKVDEDEAEYTIYAYKRELKKTR